MQVEMSGKKLDVQVWNLVEVCTGNTAMGISNTSVVVTQGNYGMS